MSQVVDYPRDVEILSQLRKHRLLMEVEALDYKRTLKAALAEKIPQKVIANTLGVSQPAVTKALKSAATVPDVLEDRDAATPYELCQRYAAGLISREDMINELVEWPYPPTPIADEFGGFQGAVSGTFDDVVLAENTGLINANDYAEIFARLTAL